ncbi:hypothetical protein HNR65_002150 [Desulfosalsimonas propionicica]|uniref:DNA (cytosine-5-)-methyltransferase n=1 Tax=Desulfosalsimonas propionicica TaxID=332175 RepID=A0A7W0C9T4_9BACT|nr:DNA cytosine methyltransferase [Desulfosalsimonas propionicica]MBA2881819.1 hypothetical protein [Desulfosalsimonas propionicica]
MLNQPPFLLSVYDYTGNWARPYIDAGWRVLLWDQHFEGSILEGFGRLVSLVEEENEGRVDGLLAAPPCTAFAASGARWWQYKDSPGSAEPPWESFTEQMVGLTLIVWEMVVRFRPRFWALENPVGRIEKLCPELKPFRRMSFNPCDYGDPYIKKTILWGDFNPNLPRNPVRPVEGSKMHRLPAGRRRSELRSVTPSGFARAFYKANHDLSINFASGRQLELFAS